MKNFLLEMFFATRHRHTKWKHNPSGKFSVAMYVQKAQKHHSYTKSSIHGRAVKWHMDYSTAVERGGGYNYLVPIG